MRYKLLQKCDYIFITSLLDAFCTETKIGAEGLIAIFRNLRSDKTTVFIAEESGVIYGTVGFIVVGEIAVPDFFYVVPDKRNGLVGGRLYNEVIKHCKKIGVKTLAPVVTEEKEKLYLKLGFVRKFIVLEKEIK